MADLGVFLVRHEDAADADDDWHRALTGRGRRRMRATAALVAQQPDLVDFIYTSPLVRAVQTAEILAAAVGVDEPIVVRREIASPPAISSLVRLFDDVPAPYRGVAVVGHEPALSALASHLLRGKGSWTGFEKGAVLALGFDRSTGTASFRWWIRPDVAEPVLKLP